MKKNLILFCALVALFWAIPVIPDAKAEDKPAELNNQPAAQIFPKLPTTPDDPHLDDAKVYPMWGPLCMRYTYSVVYQDDKNRAPEYMRMYFNGKWLDLAKENKNDSDYKKGVKYVYKFVPNKLGSNFYFFEASNGKGKARDGIIDSPDNGPVLFETDFSQNEIALIDPKSGQKLWSYPTHKEWVKGVALSDDGKYLAATTTKHIYFFETSKQNPLWSYQYQGSFDVENNDVKGGVDVSVDGSKIFALIGKYAILFSKDSNQPIWQKDVKQQGYNTAISADGKYMAAGTAGDEKNVDTNLLILWSEKSATPLWQYHAAGNFHDVSLSFDGSYIAGATGCPDRRAYIFSKDSNEPVMRSDMLAEDSPVNRAKISADGKYVAYSAEYNKGIAFLFKNPKFGGSNQPVWKLLPPSQRSGRALAMTPDAKTILETTFAGDVLTLGLASNQPTAYWKYPNPIAAADLSDDGRLIAIGGTAEKVYLIDGDSKKQTAEVQFSEYISEIDVAGDGKYVAAGTGGANYFFESFSQNENKKVSCDKVIEPEPEMVQDQTDSKLYNGVQDVDQNLPGGNKVKQFTQKNWLIIVSTLACLIILFSIIFGKTRKKYWLIIIILLIIALVLSLIFFRKPPKSDLEKTEQGTQLENQ